MPNSIIGLVIFVLLLLPGLVYVIARELRAPARSTSNFRETAAVAAASVVFDGMVLGAFALLRVAAPDRTPDVGRLLREGGSYTEAHYRQLGAWTVALLLAACVLAAIAARYSPGWANRFTDVTFYSAWWGFNRGPDRPSAHMVLVGCELEDGSYLSGELLTLSTEVEETADRDIVLRPPIRYQAAGADGDVELDVSGVVLSARRLKFLTYTYVPLVAD